jgi:hypothetical protein
MSARDQESCDDNVTSNYCAITTSSSNSQSNSLPIRRAVTGPSSRSELYTSSEGGDLPAFRPSKAAVPLSIDSSGDTLKDLLECARDKKLCQSFWSDLSVVSGECSDPASPIVLRDEILHVPPFDETLYCQLVLENHRYSLAELYDNDQAAADARASRAMKWGSLYGMFTLNPLVPFIASSQARASAPRHKKIEELIPDPRLMFLQDHYSLLAMTQAGNPLPRMRRLILHLFSMGDQISLRILPAILTHDSVIPCQVFSCAANYFMRPVCAGILHEQGNYNARHIHRQYYHLRADGCFVDTGIRALVKGADIDAHRYKLFKYISDTRELEYFYVDYQTEPSHVF